MLLILEANDLEKDVEEEAADPKGDEAKTRHKKNMVRENIIIAYSIKDHLIHHISSLKTPN